MLRSALDALDFSCALLIFSFRQSEQQRGWREEERQKKMKKIQNLYFLLYPTLRQEPGKSDQVFFSSSHFTVEADEEVLGIFALFFAASRLLSSRHPSSTSSLVGFLAFCLIMVRRHSPSHFVDFSRSSQHSAKANKP